MTVKFSVTDLSQTGTVRSLRLHVHQVLIKIPKFLHGGVKGHNLTGGVRRGVRPDTRHDSLLFLPAKEEPRTTNNNIKSHSKENTRNTEHDLKTDIDVSLNERSHNVIT